MRRIYADHIAATPVLPRIIEGMIPFLGERYGNPQSAHGFGQEVFTALEEARRETARLINAEPEEIFFTASGSESNNLAIKGIAAAQKKKGSHIAISAIEHQSVLHSAKYLEKAGFQVSSIPVDRWGSVDPDDVKKQLRADTTLVSIMTANGEIGTIEPVQEIAEVCRENDVIFHTDAVDAAGVIPVDVKESGVDALSLAGNQFYGPKGGAALYLKKGTRIVPQIDGGIQEGGRRAGTEDAAAIVGLGLAAKIAREKMDTRAAAARELRDKLIREMPERIEHVILTGHSEQRLPHHASFCVRFIEGEAMLLSLDMKGIAASSGSACTSRALKASHVLLALGLDHATAQGSIVFSLIEENKREDIDYILEVFPPIVERLRAMSPLYAKYLEERKK